ncbi:metal ABC transporter permease [bacterium]|nr:metal ABC transporter permease [bacterium]
MRQILDSLFVWLEPSFMQRGLLALLLISPACAALGGHVIAFKMSFYSDAISHSVFTGIAIGLLLGIDTTWSTLLFGVLIGLLVNRLERSSRLSRDAIIGVLFSASVALGIVIVSIRSNLAQGFHSALYGDLLSIGNGDLLVMGFVFLLTILFEIVAYNRLLLIAVNEPMARSRGIRTHIWESLLSVWVAMVVLVGVRAVGLLMVTALLIVPAATGRNLGKSAKGSLFWAITVAVFSSFFGLAASWWLNSSAGATVILVSVFFFFVSLLLSPKRLKYS